MTLIGTLLAPAWAWALPFIAPVKLALGLWRARAREVLPANWGSLVFGAVLAIGLCWIVAGHVERWLNPPPATYTAAEIEAESLRQEVAALREANEAQARTLRERNAFNQSLGQMVEKMQTELDHERQKSAQQQQQVAVKSGRPRRPPALPADDPWLRGWEQRGW